MHSISSVRGRSLITSAITLLATAAVLGIGPTYSASADTQATGDPGSATNGTADATIGSEAAATAVGTANTSGASHDQQASAVYSGKSASGPGATAASVSLRFYWGAKNGTWILCLNGLAVGPGQAVAVSATEADAAGNEFIGSAAYQVQNVAVSSGRVCTRVIINWSSPINVWVHYLA
jgi:hypothetical protein